MFEIQKIINTLRHSRITHCLELIREGSECLSPCEGGTLSSSDQSISRTHEFGIVEQLEMCIKDFASLSHCRGRQVLQAAAHLSRCTDQFRSLMLDAAAAFRG